MRVLSFVPAFLLAAASFVAAAPTVTSSSPVSTPSCVPAGTGNDAPLQPIISIIANATAEIQPLCDQLSTFGHSSDARREASIQQGSGTPNADDVSVVVVKITAAVSTCVSQLNAAVKLVLTVLNALVAIILTLAGGIVGTLKTDIGNLLNAVLDLVGCLKVFVNASVSGVLGLRCRACDWHR
ncbi:hypothetical protein JVU11DRAFT_8245 [Chiua virens]|nr:hypothetical protein JVU11DRAFT_8245 [Chiua virens]